MNKETEWIDKSINKIGPESESGLKPVDMAFYKKDDETQFIKIKEGANGFELTCAFGDEIKPPVETIADKTILFHVVEDLGLPAKNIVKNDKALGDFDKPVNMHKQTTEEKNWILQEVINMKPGDALTYTLPDIRSDDKKFVTKGQNVILACIEKDKLQYLFRDILDDSKTEEGLAFPRQVRAEDIWVTNRDGTYALNHRPDGLCVNKFEPYQISDIKDIHISKERFTKKEIKTIRAGHSIDYDAVCRRQPIKDKAAYIAYVLEKNRPDFTHGPDKAEETMRLEWTGCYNRKFFEQDEKIKSGGLRIKDRMLDTQFALEKAGNTDRVDALITLSRSVKDFAGQGAEWRPFASECRAIADELPQGQKLEVSTSIMSKDEKTEILVQKLKDMYPDIDKGLEKLNEARIQKEADRFYEKQQKQLKNQTKQSREKAAVKTKTKKVQRKSAGRAMER